MAGSSNWRKRWFPTAVVPMIAAGAVLGSVAVGDPANATTPTVTVERARPTIVLEHGAFADGSSWSSVITRLRADGYPVVAPANPLRGPAADAAVLRSVLDGVKGPKVLVGHSYGGSVISAAGANDPEVKALVYVAAFLPAPGETALELTNKFPGSTLPDALNPVTYTPAGGTAVTDLYIQADKFRHLVSA
ncbi:alpha/beta fold hydrolase [Kitasatospora herbaricolor]|uniref:alpha/beta fold hydrolase n=1 Tax=Kitasatospora herbaricolor TaxID=68217 RepID=UPI0036D9F12D